MKKLNVGIIGLGQRGYDLTPLFCSMDNLQIISVCDVLEERVQREINLITEKTGKTPVGYTDWHKVIEERPDAVLIVTGWEDHLKIAFEAMKAGIPVGCEVGGAYSIEDCYELIRVQKETGTPFCFLENCCYGRYEMLVMNMVKQGLFGEIVSCEGGYRHDLRTEVLYGRERHHYRLNNYMNRNCENYPTHDLGPISQVLDINRGNKFMTLTSFASKAAGLHDYAVTHETVNRDLLDVKFKQGDIVKTIIECQRGELITLTLDTTLPRPYSRNFTVQGTRGMYCEDGNYIYLDRDHDETMHFDWALKRWHNADTYFEQYDHPVWKKFLSDGVRGGHGGMDYLVYNEFAECILNGTDFPITPVDAACWMAVTPLSAISIKERRTVDFPDFSAN